MFSKNMESIVSINIYPFIHASHAAATQYIKLDDALGRGLLFHFTNCCPKALARSHSLCLLIGGLRDPAMALTFPEFFNAAKSSSQAAVNGSPTNPNADIETCLKNLKAELIWHSLWQGPWQTEAGFLEYINDFYNPQRRH
jgi:hypothetical protein